MKKMTTAVLALIAIFAIGAIANAAPDDKPKKVKTKAGLNYTPGADSPTDPYDQAYSRANFSGKVKAKKGCKKGRTVKVRGIGTDKTNKRGRYSISGGAAAAPDGNYRAVVKKKVRKGGDIVCKRARSSRETVS